MTFVGDDVLGVPLIENNSLSGWGLGGAQPLATAKARLYLASTVYSCAGNSLLEFVLESS